MKEQNKTESEEKSSDKTKTTNQGEKPKSEMTLNSKNFYPRSQTQKFGSQMYSGFPMMSMMGATYLGPNMYNPYSFSKFSNPQSQMSYPSSSFGLNQRTADSKIKLDLKNSRPFIPSKLKHQRKTVDKYFLVDEEKKQDKKSNFDYAYMISFANWKICKNDDLLSEDLKKHLEDFNISEIENIKLGGNKKMAYKSNYGYKKDYNRKNESNDNPDFKRNSDRKFQTAAVTDIKGIGQWARHDISKELALAAQFKEKLNEHGKTNPIKFDLTAILNQLTVDNYEEKKEEIFNIIEPSVEHQITFLDVLFTKAISEKAFVQLYAKLCKDLDKKLPQKCVSGKNTKTTTELRSKLIDKCRKIFKLDHNEQFESYVKADSDEERDLKTKKFIIGNVEFIGELINIQVLSKKIVQQCIDNLFSRYNDQNGDIKLKLVNLEAISRLLEKFGTLLKKKLDEGKIKEEDYNKFQKQIDEYCVKLDEIQNNTSLPGHVKYKIINLIARKNDGWQENKVDKSTVAKSKEQVKKEYEESQKNVGPLREEGDERYTQDEINDKIKSDIKNYRDHLKEFKTSNGYNWNVVEDIYKKRGNKMKEIISAYIDSCIDIVERPYDLEYTSKYIKEIIGFYKLRYEEIKDIVDEIMYLLDNINSFCYDNNKIIQVWGNLLFELFELEYLNAKDFDQLSKTDSSNIEPLLKILIHVVLYDSNYSSFIENIEIVKNNKNIFDGLLISEGNKDKK